MNLSTHSTPLLRNVSAQSALQLSIQPHTSYDSGDIITQDLESPAAGTCNKEHRFSVCPFDQRQLINFAIKNEVFGKQMHVVWHLCNSGGVKICPY